MAQGGFVGVPEVRTTARSQGQIKEAPVAKPKKVYECIRCERVSTNSLDVCLSTDAVYYCKRRGKPKQTEK
jgi:hypothetical protein